MLKYVLRYLVAMLGIREHAIGNHLGPYSTQEVRSWNIAGLHPTDYC